MPILESISRKSAKMNIFLRIAFHGADFYGTQKQKDKPTIQGLFEDLLSKIYNTPIKVTISSRLDRFVSALDFGLTFFSPNDKYTLSYLSFHRTERGWFLCTILRERKDLQVFDSE